MTKKMRNGSMASVQKRKGDAIGRAIWSSIFRRRTLRSKSRELLGRELIVTTSLTVLVLTVVFSLLFWPTAVTAAWGWTDSKGNYVIDSGADLFISVSKPTGDINSLKYKGQDFNGWVGKNT